ncbi:hypothetical protein [Mesorhizobium shangrilense]|uniref:Uncharacterized protein n=1 Tax=Mesorhizobium shangrilense TaxID=460060 RepID=A0ABV2D659_9HYPH
MGWLKVGLVALLTVSASAAQAGDSYGFRIDLSLSAKAASELARLHEGIVVAASYYGDPKPAFAKKANEVGQIDLGREEITVDSTVASVDVTGKAFERGHVKWLTEGKVMVNVNVYSARRSGPDNILDCDFFDDALTLAQQAPLTLHCKLIGEP